MDRMSYFENMYLKQKQSSSQGQGICSGASRPGGGLSGGSLSGGGMAGGGMAGGGMAGGGMAGGPQCSASTPAVLVQIQPPPFVLKIPGPTLIAPSQPLCIQQHNPCALPAGICGPGGGQGVGQGGGQGGRKSLFFEEYPADMVLESEMAPYCGYYPRMGLPYYY